MQQQQDAKTSQRGAVRYRNKEMNLRDDKVKMEEEHIHLCDIYKHTRFRCKLTHTHTHIDCILLRLMNF